MYKVTVIDDEVEYLLHEPRDDSGELQLINPVVILQIGKTGDMEFQILPEHPNVGHLKALISEIRVYDDDEIIYRGRPINKESDFYNLALISVEGELSYLCDSIQRPYDITGTIVDFFQQVLAVHNSQVEEHKRFEIGNITVAGIGNEAERVSTEFTNSLLTLKGKLTEVYGGYLHVRREDGKNYLDYVSDYGGINDQIIRFGENLLDLTRYVDPIHVITALIPRGAEIQTEDEEEEKRYVDITSVNDGKDYIYDEDAVKQFGWIFWGEDFEDAADPEVLLIKARAYLDECVALPETIEVTALDLGLIDVDVKKLKVGYWTQIESRPHGISKRFMLAKKAIYLDNPGKDTVWLGQTLPSFTANAGNKNLENANKLQKLAQSTTKEIIQKIANATALITGGKGGYVVLDIYDPDTGEKMHPWRILVMDTPDKDTAKSVIQINKNGIGFSTTGINGPYRNAWTIDGNLVADFITAGTMLADRIRGGILEIGGSGLGKDGRIVVMDKDDDLICELDKTGLHVYKGVIEGSEIIGSTIRGGYIYGSEFESEIFHVTDEEVRAGKFVVKLDKDGVFQTEDGGTGMAADGSSGIAGHFWAGVNSPMDYGLIVGLDNVVKIGKDIKFSDSWSEGDSALDMFKQLYERTNELKRRIESLEG